MLLSPSKVRVKRNISILINVINLYGIVAVLDLALLGLQESSVTKRLQFNLSTMRLFDLGNSSESLFVRRLRRYCLYPIDNV